MYGMGRASSCVCARSCLCVGDVHEMCASESDLVFLCMHEGGQAHVRGERVGNPAEQIASSLSESTVTEAGRVRNDGQFVNNSNPQKRRMSAVLHEPPPCLLQKCLDLPQKFHF